MIEITGFPIKAIGGAPAKLVDLSVAPAEAVAIAGPSDSGKTRLCLALCGLSETPPGCDVRFDGLPLTAIPDRRRLQDIAFVPSDPSLLFSGAKSTLAGELELSAALLGTADLPEAAALERIVASFRLKPLLGRDPFLLSGGEAVRAALALAVLRRPRLLVIDEAFAFLDPESLHLARRALDDYLPPGSTLIETMSDRVNPLPSGSVVDSVAAWSICRSPRKLTISPMPALEPFVAVPCATPAAEAPTETVLEVEDLAFAYPNAGFRLAGVNLRLARGDRLILVGANGVGKTTLLRSLALLLEPSYRRLAIVGEDGEARSPPPRRRRHEWARSALYCFQRPDDQLYLPTVEAEVIETARRLGRRDYRDRGLDAADRLGLTPVLSASPFDLPSSVRRLIPLAAAIGAAPPILLLDEPSAGLDTAQCARLVAALTTAVPESAMVIVTHDYAFASCVGSAALELRADEASGSPALHAK